MSVTITIISISFSILSCILIFLYKKYNYWSSRNVPHVKPTFIVGNYLEYLLQKKNVGEVAQDICRQFPNELYVGSYYGTEPALIVQDLELIKLITTKDFYYFNGREISRYTDKETNTKNMFFTHGDRWKVIRQNMSPLFTGTKIKKMFYLIEKCACMFEDMLDNETDISDAIEGKALMARYTMDGITSCGFGINSNTMKKDIEKNPFTLMGDLIFGTSIIRGVALAVRSMWPAIFYGLGLTLFTRKIANFFDSVMMGVFEKRGYEPSTRNDFVDMILNLRQNEYITSESLSNMKNENAKKIKLKIDNDFLIAQCVLFFAAGFETSASTLSFALYELAKHPEAQKKAFEEVDAYLSKHGNKLDYDCVTELPYLDACLNETLRLYPVFGVVTREVMEEYTLPNGVQLDKGVRIHIPVQHLHRHPDYFPEPEKYRPERFLPENKHNIKPYTYMPFGEGPRNCIGMRFAKMQALPGLLTVLKKFHVELAADMPLHVTMDPSAIVTQSREKLRLKFKPREGWQRRVYAL